MQTGRFLTTTTALLTLLAVSPLPAAAQSGRTWTDPPAEGAAAPPQAPSEGAPPPAAPPPQAATPSPEPAPAPTQSAQPKAPVPPPEPPAPREAERKVPPAAPSDPAVAAKPLRNPDEEKRAERTAVAKNFAVDYLESWSSPNDVALEATAAFYAPRVLFHGREVSMQRLFNEKRRFARRWPDREYRPRQDALGTVCNPAGEICTVHAVFDFTASHPKRRRVSQGTGALQLVVHFIGDKPVIVAEHSTLLGQERKRNLALEGASDD